MAACVTKRSVTHLLRAHKKQNLKPITLTVRVCSMTKSSLLADNKVRGQHETASMCPQVHPMIDTSVSHAFCWRMFLFFVFYSATASCQSNLDFFFVPPRTIFIPNDCQAKMHVLTKTTKKWLIFLKNNFYDKLSFKHGTIKLPWQILTDWATPGAPKRWLNVALKVELQHPISSF